MDAVAAVEDRDGMPQWEKEVGSRGQHSKAMIASRSGVGPRRQHFVPSKLLGTPLSTMYVPAEVLVGI